MKQVTLKQSAMNKQSGFTLIELVIVIIILGILSATAIPKFLDLQSDARESAMNGVKSALEGAATITYSKAAIQGIETSSVAVATDENITTIYGYPDLNQSTGIAAAVELDTTDWVFDYDTTGSLIITAANDSSGCQVAYTPDTTTEGTRPDVVVSGCD